MKNTLMKKITPTVLIICMLTSGFFASYQTVYGVGQADLDNIQSEKEEKEKDLAATLDRIEALKSQAADAQAYISSLDGLITEIDTSLYNLQIQIADLEAQIVQSEAELAQAEVDRDEQYKSMKLRIQYMYEHNDENYFALLMTAQSMAEMLNRAEYITKISEYDREMLIRFQETMDFIADTKSQLESNYAEVVAMEADLVEQKESLAYLQSTKAAELTALRADTAEAESLQASIESDLSELDKQTAIIEEQIRQQELNNQGSATLPGYDGGLFKWPTVNTYITSDFGDPADRNAPHKGIDVAPVTIGVSGDDIYAAYDGTVVEAYNNGQWNGGAGNYITIYHGNGLYTRYLHLSGVFVSPGQSVTRGQTIGLMGTTGNSTGVHLHFDVRLNGSYVNPWNYLG